MRFERDARAMLKPLALHPYRSVMQMPLSPVRQPQPYALPSVERRPLSVYGRLAGARMSALRSFARAIRGMLADLKMAGSLEAVDAILSDIDGGFLQPPSDQSPAGGADHAA